MTDKNVVNRLLTDMCPMLLAWEEPVLPLCPGIGSADIGDEESISLVRKDSVAVRTIFTAGNIDTVFR